MTIRNQYPLIGGGSGKLLRCHPEASSSYSALEAFASSGNHWARLAVESIRSLSRGHAMHRRVYIKHNVKNDKTLIEMLLPGISVLLDYFSDDSYVVKRVSFQSGCNNLALSDAFNTEISIRDRTNSEVKSQKSNNELLMHFERYDGQDGTSGMLYLYRGFESIYEGVAYNAPTNLGDEPFGTNGQLAIGSYRVTRRQCGECLYKDNPAISNVGVPGNVRTPSGRIRSGIVMHRGYGPHHSQGCLVSPDMYDEDGPIGTLMRFDQYSSGGMVPLHITYQDG